MTTAVPFEYSPQHCPVVNEIKERVLQAVKLQRLYLLGLTLTSQRTQGVFAVPSAATEEISHCHLLAVAEGRDVVPNRIQDIIENNLQHFLPVTAIVLSAKQFANWLAEGHPFAVAVHEWAHCLYESEAASLPVPGPVDESVVAKANAALLSQTKIKVREFLAGADLFTLRQQYGLATFMLHQAAEQALTAQLTINTSLWTNTHNLDKLVRYNAMWCATQEKMFSRKSEEDRRLVGLLQRAYVGGRYAESYLVTRHELAVITEQTKLLIERLI